MPSQNRQPFFLPVLGACQREQSVIAVFILNLPLSIEIVEQVLEIKCQVNCDVTSYHWLHNNYYYYSDSGSHTFPETLPGLCCVTVIV